jgi:hypothetical protein
VAALIVHTGVEFTLLEPQELAQPLGDIAEQLLRGVRPARQTAPEAARDSRA